MADEAGTHTAKAAAKAKAKEERESLAKMTQNKLLNEIKSSLDTHVRSATFACGGAVPFRSTTPSGDLAANTASEGTPQMSKISQVQVRFGESGKVSLQSFLQTLPQPSSRSLLLPVSQHHSVAAAKKCSMRNIAKLASSMRLHSQPASVLTKQESLMSSHSFWFRRSSTISTCVALRYVSS